MSRVANNPIELPSGVEFTQKQQQITVKGSKGTLEFDLHELVKVNKTDNTLTFAVANDSTQAKALSGTSRAIINNMVVGVSKGFQKKLMMVGVGYKAILQGKNLKISAGFSHDVDFPVPEGVKINLPSQTEVIVEGIDKQLVGQVAANIRAIRKPEPYKGKGIRYADEHVIRKETKKK